MLKLLDTIEYVYLVQLTVPSNINILGEMFTEIDEIFDSVCGDWGL